MYGRKDDLGKLRWSLIPWAELEDVVRVLETGAAVYDDWNWQIVPNAVERYKNAAMRHLVAYNKGEVLDPKSGLPHLAHLACNALFLMWFDNDLCARHRDNASGPVPRPRTPGTDK